MFADLQAAADVGAHHQLSATVAEVGGLDPAQFRGFLGLHQVVNPGAAATHPRFHRLPQLDVGDGG